MWQADRQTDRFPVSLLSRWCTIKMVEMPILFAARGSSHRNRIYCGDFRIFAMMPHNSLVGADLTAETISGGPGVQVAISPGWSYKLVPREHCRAAISFELGNSFIVGKLSRPPPPLSLSAVRTTGDVHWSPSCHGIGASRGPRQLEICCIFTL